MGKRRSGVTEGHRDIAEFEEGPSERRLAYRLFLRAVRAQPEVFEREALIRWIERNAAGVGRLWVEGRIVGDTVNDPGRQHIPGPNDILFMREDGRLERYRSPVHGWWSRAGLPMDADFLGTAAE
jgi:hypothetical protein